MSKRAILSAIALLIVCVLGAFYPIAPQTKVGGALNTGDTAWMLTATGLVLLMTPGLSFFYGGLVSSRNMVSTMLQSFIAMGIISILWVVIGFSLAFGDSIGGLIGDPRTFFMLSGVGVQTHPDLAPTIPLMLFVLFQLKFAIITPALIAGSFAERVKFSSYCFFICLFSLFIYCPLAHMTWHPDGLLRKLGVLDFAGGTVVHMSAGLAALAGAIFLGRRRAHLNNEHLPPSNIPYVILGTGMLWFGWFGFNAGSALAASESAVSAFLVTNTASASAMITWLILDVLKGKKASGVSACIAAVVGLVAITPASGFATVGASIVIGALSALVSNLAVAWRSRTNIDDTLDVFPCHGVGGIMGVLLTGVFATSGGLAVTGNVNLFMTHVLACIGVSAFSLVGSLLLYKVTDIFVPLRVNEQDEQQGLDVSQHGETAMVIK